MKTDVEEESSSLNHNEQTNSKQQSGHTGTASFTTAPGYGGGLLGDWGEDIEHKQSLGREQRYRLIEAQSLRNQKNEKLA